MATITLGSSYVKTFRMILTSDHLTGATGKTVTVLISKAGGAYAAAAGAVAEIANGDYKVSYTPVDTNTAGDLRMYATAAACDPTDGVDQVDTGTSLATVNFSASAANICSQALISLGDQTINALDDSSDRSRACTLLYPLVRNYAQAIRPWKCCITRVQLNPDAVAPIFGWATSYTVPSDFLRIVSDGEESNETDQYRMEAGPDGKLRLLTDDTGVLNLRYCKVNTDETAWPITLVMCMVAGMRAALAYNITQSGSLEQAIIQAIKEVVKEAKGIDGKDQPPETFGDFRLLQSRFGSFPRAPF